MTRFEELERLQQEIQALEAVVRQLARAALRIRSTNGGAYEESMARYDVMRQRLQEKKNRFRAMLGEDPLPM